METVPVEVWEEVLHLLSPCARDLVSFGATSAYWLQVTRTSAVWKRWWTRSFVGAWVDFDDILPQISWFDKVRGCRHEPSWTVKTKSDAAAGKKKPGLVSRLFSSKKKSAAATAKSGGSTTRSTFPAKDEYKITLLGPGGTGAKSTVVVRYVEGYFRVKYDPTIEDQYICTKDWNGTKVRLDLLDTAGQEEYSSLRDHYIQRGGGFLLGYSITSRGSFKDMVKFRDQVLRTLDLPPELVAMVLIGNKKDLEDCRDVSTEEGEALARRWGIPFFETSAKTNENIDECFMELGRRIDLVEKLMSGSSKFDNGILESSNGSVYSGTILTEPTAVPFQRGEARYSEADSPVISTYNGEWMCGRKHGTGTLTLRGGVSSKAAAELKSTWEDGLLVSVNTN